jgi:hypothetical protein
LTRIINIPPHDRDGRYDLQPSNSFPQLFNIDPSTGLTVDSQYDVVDAGGSVIQTDAEGNPVLGSNTVISFSPMHSDISYSRLITVTDTNIGELTVGVGVLTEDYFGKICGVGEVDGEDPLLIKIRQLEMDILRLNGLLLDQDKLQTRINELTNELRSVTDELEDLVDEVERLQTCNTSLENTAEVRDDAVQELSVINHRLSLENATLRSEILRLGGNLDLITVIDLGGGGGGGDPISSDIQTIRSIGERLIGRLDDSSKLSLTSEIKVVRTSIALPELHESLDLILAKLSSVVIDALEGEITTLESLLGNPFVYIYGTRDDLR